MSTIVGQTSDQNDSGVFGRNDANAPAQAGSVGGNGVFGLSLVPNASGVFGANNSGGTGVFGESPTGDGMIGATQSSAKSGVFGKNDATAPSPAGSVGGNGVFGLSLVPNASGVFGANNAGGTGVFGESPTGDGMIGATQSSAKSGVFGKNDATAPSPAGTVGGNGVFGLSLVPNASGVFGANNGGGNGVAGISERGIGVFAKGGLLAGFFDGNAEVTGHLKVNGQDLSDQIAQLRATLGDGNQGPLSRLDNRINTILQIMRLVVPVLQTAGLPIPTEVVVLLQRL